MEFEWDDAKSDACFADRGFDFGYVAHVFLDEDRIVGVDRRWDYFGPQGQPQGGSRV